MDTNFQSEVRSKRFAHRIATMIEARLIWYKHYFRWADQLILELPDPPYWVVEIATIYYYPDAVAAINRFVDSWPYESFDDKQCNDEHVAFLFLRYQAGAISWATFLNDAGLFIDTRNGRHECEYYYAFLNELEHNEYSHEVESRQRTEIESEFEEAISEIRPIYDMFMFHFRHYVANEE